MELVYGFLEPFKKIYGLFSPELLNNIGFGIGLVAVLLIAAGIVIVFMGLLIAISGD